MTPENSAAKRRVELDQAYLQHYRTPTTPPAFSVALSLQVVQEQEDGSETLEVHSKRVTSNRLL